MEPAVPHERKRWGFSATRWKDENGFREWDTIGGPSLASRLPNTKECSASAAISQVFPQIGHLAAYPLVNTPEYSSI